MTALDRFVLCIVLFGPFFGSFGFWAAEKNIDLSYIAAPQIFNWSFTAAAVICAVLLVRLALKKAPKIYSYILWGIVLLRLLCPVSVSYELSLLNVMDIPASESGVVEYIPTVPGEVDIPIPGVSEVINSDLPVTPDGSVYTDAYEFPRTLGFLLWTLGVRVMGIYGIVSYILLRRKLIGAVKLRDNIYITDGIATPFVTGLFRPKIYLPSSLSERETDYIILHEQHHIRRGDHIIKLLAFTALAIHWFNPLAWLAFVLSGKDMEMSCDESVTKDFDADARADYSESLLRLATCRRIIAGTPLAFGEGKVSGRIKNLLNYRKPTFWAAAGAIILLAVAAVTLLTNPKETGSTAVEPGIYEGGDMVYNFTGEDVGPLAVPYCITDSGHLFREIGGQWIYVGGLIGYDMSLSEFSSYTQNDEGWLTSDNIGSITDCWQVETKDDSFWLFLQTSLGKSYVATGWEDLSERNQPGSDDTYINAIWEMEYTGETASPELPNTVANPITSTRMSAFMHKFTNYPVDAGCAVMTRLADNQRLYYTDETEKHVLTVAISSETELSNFITLLSTELDIDMDTGVYGSLRKLLRNLYDELADNGLLLCYVPEWQASDLFLAGPCHADNGTLTVELQRESDSIGKTGCAKFLVIRVPKSFFEACHSYDVILSE